MRLAVLSGMPLETSSTGRALARTTTFLVSLAIGCGASGGASSRTSSFRIEPASFFVEVAATRTDLLVAPSRAIEELEAARESARGAERREVLVELARAHLVAAGPSADRETRRHRASAERFAKASANGSRDDTVRARADFVELWLAFRAGDRRAAGRATRFTRQRAQSGELALLAWVIQGELAFAAERWDDARAAYRYVLGQLGHPLYAYALYRTAQSHTGAGHADDARETLAEVALLGCSEDADEPTRRVALAAATDLGVGARRDGDVDRPASCPEPTSESESGREGWRPPE